MKEILLALSGLPLLACTPAAIAADEASLPVCISLAPAGFCDAMEFDGRTKATWHNYDCAGSQGKQTRALYRAMATTDCDGTKGCNPSVFYGWDRLSWSFDTKASTGTLTGVIGGQKQVLGQDIPVSITAGACDVSQFQGGVSLLAR